MVNTIKAFRYFHFVVEISTIFVHLSLPNQTKCFCNTLLSVALGTLNGLFSLFKFLQISLLKVSTQYCIIRVNITWVYSLYIRQNGHFFNDHGGLFTPLSHIWIETDIEFRPSCLLFRSCMALQPLRSTDLV